MKHVEDLGESQVVIVVFDLVTISYHQIVVVVYSGLQVRFKIEVIFFSTPVYDNEGTFH